MRAGNGALLIVWRALVTMLVCYIIGLVVGYIANKVIEDNINEYKEAHPIPDDEEKPQSRSAPIDETGGNVDIIEDGTEDMGMMQDAA
jgi:hypothetical protein